MRALRNLFALVVIVVVLGAGALVAFRVARPSRRTPRRSRPNLVAVSSAGTYLYAARVGTHVVLFDTGADPAGNPVDMALAGLHAGRGDVSEVFLTHAHGDHTAAAGAAQQRARPPRSGRRPVRRGAGPLGQPAPPRDRQGNGRAVDQRERPADRRAWPSTSARGRRSRRSRCPATPPARTRFSTTACCSWATRRCSSRGGSTAGRRCSTATAIR